MVEHERKRPMVDLGVFARAGQGRGLTNGELIALALSLVWLVLATLFFFVTGGREAADVRDPLRGLMVAIAIFMPIALIWVAAIAASSARSVREETARLQESLDSMRQAYVAQRQMSGMGVKDSLERKLDSLIAAQKETDAKLATFSSSRLSIVTEAKAAAAESDADVQSDLGFESAEAEPPITVHDFITALNFPKTAEDRAGFDALARAMRDRRAAELIQASQDVLTLLSQDGIYMDDMMPDRARPEVWRRFAKGERGRPVAELGGIRDRSGIALAAARMRRDHVFRDTVHHFLRKFDQVFSEFAEHASDAEIAALAETRTARGFMLLGRVAGTFD
ncbi:MAG: hypothetical protein AAF771_02820 [Pseudomonadota bacterium]